MKKFINIIFIVVVSISAVYGKDKTVNVGVTLLSAPYGQEKTQLKMALWYPTYDVSKKLNIGPYILNIAKDAKPIEKKHKLIVISHGTRGSYIGHNDTASYLVLKGFIVLSVLHPHDNYKDYSNSHKAIKLINRPKHIKVALDTVLENKKIKPLIDEKNIGIVGFSAGGYTALALLGGEANPNDILEYCSKVSNKSIFCRENSNSSFKDKEFLKPIKDTKDSRIKAAVLLAPFGIVFNHKDSLKNVDGAIRIYRAEKDKILQYPYNTQLIKQKLPNAEYIVVENAGHNSFLAPFEKQMKKNMGELALDPVGFDRNKFHKKLNQEIADFFNRKLVY